jgi:hypothetical protein
MKTKKGAVDEAGMVVVFIILNLVWFASVLVFVHSSLVGAIYYEELYAKDIALLIDNSVPNTILELDIKKLFEVGEKADLNDKNLKKMVSIEENTVVVDANNGASKYVYPFFSNYNVKVDINTERKILRIFINE